MSAPLEKTFRDLARRVESCALCPRLAEYRATITGPTGPYWNRAVAGFGDPRARLWVVGLAPGAHGANRTGRPFTGDSAGIWLYRALFEFGFSTAPESVSRNDGLELKGAFISNVVRCVPPLNKPQPDEIRHCAAFFDEETHLLKETRVVLALGRVAHEGFLRAMRRTGKLGGKVSDYPFGHGRSFDLGAGLSLFDSYHTSRYNTSTGVLTWEMFRAVMAEVAKAAVDGSD